MQYPRITTGLWFVLAACALPSASLSEDICPAPVYSGQWTAQMVGQVDLEMFLDNIGAYTSSTPASATYDAVVDGSACDGSFVLSLSTSVTTLRMPLTPSADDRYVFAGSTDHNEMTWDMRLRVQASDSMAAGYGALFDGVPDAIVQANNLGLALRYRGNSGGNRPECTCRSQLEKFIATSLDSNRKYRDAYANTEWRKRPVSWPPDQGSIFGMWKQSTYNRVIDLIVLGLPYQEAVDRVLENSNSLGDKKDAPDYLPPETGELATGSDSSGSAAPEYETVMLAQVDSDCNLTLGDAFTDSCFPEIEMEGTLAHEAVHIADCKAGKNRSRIENHAEQEVRAYQAEIDFLENWIPSNCGG